MIPAEEAPSKRSENLMNRRDREFVGYLLLTIVEMKEASSISGSNDSIVEIFPSLNLS